MLSASSVHATVIFQLIAERMRRLPLLLMLMLGLVATSEANSAINKTVGDEVVLRPDPVTGPITVITWKCNKDIIAEWFRNKLTFNDPFKGRCKLNTTTGELIISNLTLEDSGSYIVEINNKVLNTTKIKIIFPVSTPTISTRCDDQMTHCVLTCEVNTTDSEPVTYTWWSGDMMMKSKTKELRITKEEKETSFICEMKNPVGHNRSEEVSNPFITFTSSSTTGKNNNGLYWLLVPVVVLVVGVIVVAIGVFIYICSRENLSPLLLRVLPCFKTKAGAAQLPVTNKEYETVNGALIDINNDPARLQQ